jgi:hypothetical protein
MMVLMPSILSTIDMDEFMAVYKVFADSLFDVSEAITEILDDTVKTKTEIALDAGDLEMDLVRDQLAEAVYTCLDERIKTLLSEYEARLQAYELQRNFLNYYQKHPGLEHKAGVPKAAHLFWCIIRREIQQSDTGRGSNIFTTNTFASSKEATARTASGCKASSSASASSVAKLFLAKSLRITPEKATGEKAKSKQQRQLKIPKPQRRQQ